MCTESRFVRRKIKKKRRIKINMIFHFNLTSSMLREKLENVREFSCEK